MHVHFQANKFAGPIGAGNEDHLCAVLVKWAIVHYLYGSAEIVIVGHSVTINWTVHTLFQLLYIAFGFCECQVQKTCSNKYPAQFTGVHESD